MIHVDDSTQLAQVGAGSATASHTRRPYVSAPSRGAGYEKGTCASTPPTPWLTSRVARRRARKAKTQTQDRYGFHLARPSDGFSEQGNHLVAGILSGHGLTPIVFGLPWRKSLFGALDLKPIRTKQPTPPQSHNGRPNGSSTPYLVGMGYVDRPIEPNMRMNATCVCLATARYLGIL